MDTSKLKRDPAKVLSALRELPNGALATTAPLHIHVPESFRAKQILLMGEDITAMGYFALILESGEYGLYMIPSMIDLNPSQTTIIEVNGKTYYDFFFEAGTVVIKQTELFKDNILLYNLIDELLSRGRIPWYYTYEDMVDFFVDVEYYTGTKLAVTPAIGEMVIAQIARNPADRKQLLRYLLTKPGAGHTTPVTWLPLRNVSIGAEGLTAKLVGSYLDDGIDAGLLANGGKSSMLEEVLRS